MDFNKICRLCVSDASDDFLSIFDSFYNISNIVYKITNLEIREDDGLPSQICVSCFEKTKIVTQFKEQCIRADKKIRSFIIENLKIEKPTSVLTQVKAPAESIKTKSPPKNYIISNINKSKEDATEVESENEYQMDISDEFNSKINHDVSNTTQEDEIEIIEECEKIIKPDLDDDEPEYTEYENLETIEEYENTETVDEEFRIIEINHVQENIEENDMKIEDMNEEYDELNTIFKCSVCDETYHNKNDLKIHMKLDHIFEDNSEKKYQCIDCSNTYSTEESLMTHMSNHNDKSYECDQCKRIFNRLDLLVIHQKRHTIDRPFACSLCDKTFSSRVGLDRHFIKHNSPAPEKPKYKCTICGIVLTHLNHLNVHMRAHQVRLGDSKPVSSASTNASSNKKQHLCSICGRSCTSASNLDVHMRRHTGQMTKFCDICGKGYPRSTDLTLHMRRHTGEKPFVCHVCNRGFARSDKLNIHLRTHTGEKPYVCDVCGRGFAQKNDLSTHKKRLMCSNNSASRNQIKIVQEIQIPQKLFKPQHSDISRQSAVKLVTKTEGEVYSIPNYEDDSNDLSLIQEQIDDENNFGS